MPERGVSRRVTVKFDEVDLDGRIADEAVRRSEIEDQSVESEEIPFEPRLGVPAEPELSKPVIETERIDPDTLLGGRADPTPTEGDALAESWDG